MSDDSARPLRVLCLDDSPQDAEITLGALRHGGLDAEMLRVDTPHAFESALTSGAYDVILLDYTVPGYNTLDALRLAMELVPDTPCIGVSGTIGEEAAVEMIKAGARDYVLKDRLKRLPIVVTRTLEAAAERRAREYAERALERNRDLFRAVVDATPDSVYVRDLQGRHLMVNAGALKRMDKTEDEVLGHDVRSILGPDRAEEEFAQDHEAIETRSVITAEHQVTSPNGEERTILLTNGPLFDETGEPYGVFGFARDTTERKRMLLELSATNSRLERMVHQIAEIMGKVVEVRDPYTQGHEVAVARIAKLIAADMGIGGSELEGIELAGLLHDIGKLSVPAEILTKPGALSDVEFAFVRNHPESGFNILQGVDFDWPIAQIVLQHHERMDGTGYPRGLVGDEILVAARIISVADVVEAMSAHRPYRPGLGMEAAIEEISSHPEKYDPDASRACISLYERGLISVE